MNIFENKQVHELTFEKKKEELIQLEENNSQLFMDTQACSN